MSRTYTAYTEPISIKRVNANEIDWSRTSKKASRYVALFTYIANMKIGEACETTGISKASAGYVQKYCEEKVAGNYVVKFKYDPVKKVCFFRKEQKSMES